MLKRLLTLHALACALWSQSDRGVITGVVRDASGASAPGAIVTVVNVATNASWGTEAAPSGDYTVPSLPAGTYRLRVELKGFRTHQSEGLQLTAGSTIRSDVSLEVGTAQQTVNVTASLQLLQSESARIQSQVTTKFVDELPLVVGGSMRSPFDLAAIVGEVAGNGDDLRIGGGQRGKWGMTLDGVTSVVARDSLNVDWVKINTPSVDAITEFAVEAGGFKAEFGHASGGTMTFVSKSGTNQFHGTAFEFLRNDALDARTFFEQRRRVYKQHDFGATAGGPVWIPKVYNGRDKTFFFVSWEAFRNRIGATAVPLSVAPPEFYQGDLGNWVDARNQRIAVYDPATTRLDNNRWLRTPFGNNLIPASRFDSFSRTLMSLGQQVRPNVAGISPGTSGWVRNNYLASGVNVTPFDKWSVKLDHNLTSAHRLAFLFNRTDSGNTPGPGGPPGLPYPLSNFQKGSRGSDVYRLSWDYTVTPRILNRFYAGINNWSEANFSLQDEANGWKDKVCMKNVFNCDDNLTQVNFSDMTSWGGSSGNGSENITYSFRDDLTWIAGKHTFKTGYMYDASRYNGWGRQAVAGISNFDRLGTSVPLDTNVATGGGSAFASFLLGEVHQASIGTPRFISNRFRYHAMYFQDDWRITPRFTLNLGLRYEFNLPPIEAQDQYSDFDATRPNPGADNRPGALIFAGNGPGREGVRSLVPGWYGGIGPHVGFAWSVGSKTVVRGSFARNFGASLYVPHRHFNSFVLLQDFTNQTQGLNRLFRYDEGMLPWPKPPQIDPAFSNGQVVSWWQGVEASRLPEDLVTNLSIQRMIGASSVFEVAYSAVNGTHLQSSLLNYNQLDLNALPATVSPFTAAGRTLLNSNITSAQAAAAGFRRPYSTFAGTVAQSLRPYPQYLNLVTSDGGDRSGHSTYHSMMLKYERRYSAGLTLMGSYVLSKTLTDTDRGATIDHYNRRLEKSIASYDQTHILKLNGVYELPFGKGKAMLTSGLGSRVLGGWRIGAIAAYANGTPLDLGTTINLPIFNGGNRPTVGTYDGWRAPLRGNSFDPAVDTFLQPASFFGVQPTDRLGNMTRRNPKARSFAELNENISMAKSFPIRESLRLDFRAEAFNLFNRVRFGALAGGTTLQNFNFGLWRAQTNDPRRMQVALKLYW